MARSLDVVDRNGRGYGAETPRVVCRHVVRWIVRVLVGHAGGKDGHGALLGACEIRIRIQGERLPAAAHRGGVRAARPAGDGIPIAGDVDGFAEADRHVAVDGDEPVGCASLIEHDMLTRPELSPWLAGVFVPREHRRRGIGAALVERVVAEARSLGVPRLYLYTPGSGTLYLRLGWSVVERTFYRELWGETEVTIMEFAP